MSQPASKTDKILATECESFAAAVRAILYADPDALRALLAADPSLVHQRSKSDHQCTLLHYVAANGIEDALQLDPQSVYQLARKSKPDAKRRLQSRIEKVVSILLCSGADPDAESQTYGGGPCETTLNLLCSSAHPMQAGFTERLTHLLLAGDPRGCVGGASPRGKRNDDSPLMTALSFEIWPAAIAISRHIAPELPNLFYAAIHPDPTFLRERLKQKTRWTEGHLENSCPFEIGDLSCKQIEWLKLPETDRGLAELAMFFSAKVENHDAVRLFFDAGIRRKDLLDCRIQFQ